MSVNELVVSTQIINYESRTSTQLQAFINELVAQGIPRFTLVIYAATDFLDGAPSATKVSKGKTLIDMATAAGITVDLDIHSWYTTWDSYLRDTPSVSNQRAAYRSFVKNTIIAFEGYPISHIMVLNEPQARTATATENQFILDILSDARTVTSKPLSVRFMGGYSPSTGHYSTSIDSACDFLCRNSYWDPRSPNTSVYGCTEAKLEALYAKGIALGKEVWITEFGKTKSNTSEQAAYIAAWVAYAKTKAIAIIYAWVIQLDTGEPYNLFNGMTPLPAFYELVNGVIQQVTFNLSSNPAGVPWTINDVPNKPAGNYAVNKGSIVKLGVPDRVNI